MIPTTLDDDLSQVTPKLSGRLGHPIASEPDPERIRLQENLARLREAEVFQTYRDAFEQATGMPLWLELPSDTSHGAPLGLISCPSEKVNPFCQKVFWNSNPCQACVDAHAQLAAGPGEKAATIQCFAGLQVTAVPVWLGRTILGYLRTGQVFAKTPGDSEFQAVADILRRDVGFREKDLDGVREAFMTAPAVQADKYGALVQLLIFFAEQLSAMAERLNRAVVEDLPEAVKKASEYMRRHFDEDVSLDDLSRASGVSSHHLCALFKDATGITMTEFLNRERILQAKKRLLSKYARISEVALDVGFGSLSQFNRCFARYAGESPTEYRRRIRESAGLDRAA